MLFVRFSLLDRSNVTDRRKSRGLLASPGEDELRSGAALSIKQMPIRKLKNLVVSPMVTKIKDNWIIIVIPRKNLKLLYQASRKPIDKNKSNEMICILDATVGAGRIEGTQISNEGRCKSGEQIPSFCGQADFFMITSILESSKWFSLSWWPRVLMKQLVQLLIRFFIKYGKIIFIKTWRFSRIV